MNKSHHYLVSFDAFDTLITRRCFLPSDLFLFVPHHAGNPHIDAETFKKARIVGEKLARKRFKDREVTIHEIYNEIRGLTAAEINDLMSAEIYLEEELSSPISCNISRFNSLSETVLAVVISDMYLGSTTIAEMLRRSGLVDSPIFVSSEYVRTKREGSLYDEIKQLHKKYSWVLHVGDNKHSDFDMGRKKGVETEWYGGARATRSEKLIYAALKADPSVASLVAGVIRSYRLRSSHDNQTHSNNGFFSDVLPFASLFCAAFMNWLCSELKGDDISRVFFLSRDGYVFHETYNLLAADDPSLPPSTYLRVSRGALKLAAASLLPTEEMRLDRLVSLAPKDASLRDWLEIVDVDPEPIPKYDYSLPAPQVLGEISRDSEGLPASVSLALLKVTRSCVHYLASEGFFARGKNAIVDLGWNGSLQVELDMLATQANTIAKQLKPTIKGYYWGLKNRPEKLNVEDMSAWLFDEKNKKGSKNFKMLQVLELTFGAPHPSVISYSGFRNDGADASFIESGSSEGCLDETYLSSVSNLAYEILATLDHIYPSQFRRHTQILSASELHPLVELFLYEPTPMQVRYFAQLEQNPFDSDAHTLNLIGNISDLDAILIASRMKHPPTDGFWPDGRLSLISDGIFMWPAYFIKLLRRWYRAT